MKYSIKISSIVYLALSFSAWGQEEWGGVSDGNADVGIQNIADQSRAIEFSLAQAEMEESENKWGMEGLSTWRSEYEHRGFDLAGNSMEFQLAGQYRLSEERTLDFGVFYGSATSGGDFSELTGFIDYTVDLGKFIVSGELMFHEYGESVFRSGMSLGMGLDYRINDQFEIHSLVSYDTGAGGVYLESKLEYYEEVDKDSYVILNAGVSVVADYYERNGLNHVFSKLSYTYNINDTVSVAPYLLFNLGIHNEAKTSLLGGVYFAVSF